MHLVTPNKLQAWWFHRQGLDNPDANSSSPEILQKVGWARSVGGANPYITLYARGGISRAQVDKDLASQEIHELPSARGCTYIVPKEDYALALTVGQGFSDDSAMSTARKFLGVTDAEIERLMDRVVEALRKSPLDPRQIKEAVGDAARSLGAEGKKRGQSTTLPLALGFLQSHGRIRRIPIGGRIDQQRYAYAVWDPSPLANFHISKEEAYRDLATKYFRWAGPATQDHFRWFSGLGVKLATQAISEAGLISVGDGYLIPSELADDFNAYDPPRDPIYSLVSSIDSHLLLRRDLKSLMYAEDEERTTFSDKGPLKIGGVQDLSNHAILDRGRLVGIWEYDSLAEEIVWHSFIAPDEALRHEVAKTEDYIRSELGDFRSFSLDSPASRAPVIQAIRNPK